MKTIEKVMENIVAPYRQIRIAIKSGYRAGSGWKGNEDKCNQFEEDTRREFRAEGWKVVVDEYSGFSDRVYKDGQYLYLHPMDITGYIRSENLDEITGILARCSTVSVCVVFWGDSVYEVTDDEIRAAFRSHRTEVEGKLLEMFDYPVGEWFLFDVYRRDFAVHVAGKSLNVFSLADVPYLCLKQVFDEMIANGLLVKRGDYYQRVRQK